MIYKWAIYTIAMLNKQRVYRPTIFTHSQLRVRPVALPNNINMLFSLGENIYSLNFDPSPFEYIWFFNAINGKINYKWDIVNLGKL